MKQFLGALALLAAMTLAAGHTYHLGSCPRVDPAPDFDMNKFLGKWYIVQKFSTASSCLYYNFTRQDDGQLLIQQSSEHFLLGLTNVDHKYTYTGILQIPDNSKPANMVVKFPLSVAGSASYTVFLTDYENYAGVFSCQKIAFAHRQSASILSRTAKLEQKYIDMIRNQLSSYGVNPHSFSIIDQEHCIKPDDADLNINIDDNTFTAGSVADVVRTAGDKVADGIEVGADEVRRIYDYLNKKDPNADVEYLP